MPTTPANSQLALLQADTRAISAALEKTPRLVERLADAGDPDEHAQYLVVADLTWRIWHQARAVALLLEAGLYSPALTVARSSFETLAILGYLTKHPSKRNEAIVLLAFSYLRQMKQFAEQEDLVAELNAILARMPTELVTEARTRTERHPYTWSGKKIQEMAEQGGVKGYDDAYAWLSSEAHGSAMGHHANVTPAGDGNVKIRLGRAMPVEDVEATANFARRALHSSFKVLWAHFALPKVTVGTSDPESWQGLNSR
jgi:hypothetical protein